MLFELEHLVINITYYFCKKYLFCAPGVVHKKYNKLFELELECSRHVRLSFPPE